MTAAQGPATPPDHPGGHDNRLGQIALWATVALVISMGLFRIAPVDVPWHLATGRLMLEQGVFPVTNTFSWTHPDYPLYQQYPLFQATMYGVYRVAGFVGLSLLVAATWTAAWLLWVSWGGFRAARALPLVWFVAAVGLQRHLVPRPEMFTVLGLGALLVAIDALRQHRRGAAIAVVAIQWFLVNSHQMFPLGLALQVLFIMHLVSARTVAPRLGLSDMDRQVALRPPALALLGSVAVLMVSPLGPKVYAVPLQTLQTVLVQGQGSHTGAQAQELAPVWTDPIALVVVLVLLPVLGWTLWRTRGRWSLFELGLVALGVLMVAAAVRGVHFFALISAACLTRMHARQPHPILPRESPVHIAGAMAAIGLSVLLASALQRGDPGYLAVQRGLGRTHGEWADDTIDFLQQAPPPGPMLNLGWVVGNHVIWGLHPDQPVFVDPRWEAYPKPFLGKAIAAMHSDEALASLIETWDPGYIVAEQRLPDVQDRIGTLVASGNWSLVHVDTLLVVLVRESPAAAGYLRGRRLDVGALEVPDWLPEHPQLHAQQQIRMARFYRALGRDDLATPLIEAASACEGPFARADLAALTEAIEAAAQDEQ